MKKFALLFALIGIVNYSYTNSGGSPGGKSGSPASNGKHVQAATAMAVEAQLEMSSLIFK